MGTAEDAARPPGALIAQGMEPCAVAVRAICRASQYSARAGSAFSDPPSRPSDAIALALRADCPIYVDEEVIKASKNTVPSGEESGEESALGEEEWPDVIGEAGDLPM